MTKLKVSVTKEVLIASAGCTGGKNDTLATNCAIAVAIRGIFPSAHVLKNSIDVDYWDRPGAGHNSPMNHISLPDEAAKFIETFDHSSVEERLKMQPFSFEIEIPDEVLEKINIDEIRPLLKNHPTLSFTI